MSQKSSTEGFTTHFSIFLASLEAEEREISGKPSGLNSLNEFKSS